MCAKSFIRLVHDLLEEPGHPYKVKTESLIAAEQNIETQNTVEAWLLVVMHYTLML